MMEITDPTTMRDIREEIILALVEQNSSYQCLFLDEESKPSQIAMGTRRGLFEIECFEVSGGVYDLEVTHESRGMHTEKTYRGLTRGQVIKAVLQWAA